MQGFQILAEVYENSGNLHGVIPILLPLGLAGMWGARGYAKAPLLFQTPPRKAGTSCLSFEITKTLGVSVRFESRLKA